MHAIIAKLAALSPRGRRVAFAVWTGGALAVGYGARAADEGERAKERPSGFRACCDSAQALTNAQKALPGKLAALCGAPHVAAHASQTGARIGKGAALAVVRPGTLQEALDALQLAVDADCCIVPQGANTGLTGGSVPRGADHGLDRPTVVINMTRLAAVAPIDGGARLVCLAGAGIHDAMLAAAAVGRESHSVLGSIFLNPTVAAGVAFGSGGTQVRAHSCLRTGCTGGAVSR